MKNSLLILLITLTLYACGQSAMNNSSTSSVELEQNIINEQNIMKDTPTNGSDQKNENRSTAPESVIRALIEAMKVNDAEKITSLFNANATQAYGDGAAKSGEAFFKWLKSDIIDRKGHVENAQFSVDGTEVVVTGQYSSIGYTNKANFLFSVKDGQIMSWRMRY